MGQADACRMPITWTDIAWLHMASHGLEELLAPILYCWCGAELAKRREAIRFTALPDLRHVNQWLRQLPWVARLGWPGIPSRQCPALSDLKVIL